MKKEQKKKTIIKFINATFALRSDKNDIALIKEKISCDYEIGKVKRWAAICHDKDTFLSQEQCDLHAKNNPDDPIFSVGDLIPAHWHFLICWDYQYTPKTMSYRLGVPANMIQRVKCVEEMYRYLTHDTSASDADGKYKYSSDEMEKHGFKEKQLPYIHPVEESAAILNMISNGLSLFKARQITDAVLYSKYKKDFLAARSSYLMTQIPPQWRVNIYIQGKAGQGKSSFSKELSRAICNRFFPELSYDKEFYFTAGQDGVSFQSYDAQPIIRQTDVNSSSIVAMAGGIKNLLKMVDTHPEDMDINIKYGQTRLLNICNIFDGVDSVDKFLDGLSGFYFDQRNSKEIVGEDKGQIRRRFPIIIQFDEREEYDNSGNLNRYVFAHVYKNHRFFYGEGSWLQYDEHCILHFDMELLLGHKKSLGDVYYKTMEKITAPILDLISDCQVILTDKSELTDKEKQDVEGFGVYTPEAFEEYITCRA